MIAAPRHWAVTTVLAGTLGVLGAAARAQEDSGELAHRAYALLEDRCHSCHGAAEEVKGLFVLERDALIEGTTRSGDKWLVPESPQESALWKVVESGRMPADGTSLSQAEKDLLKAWIEAGAAFPRAHERPFISEADVVDIIWDDMFRNRVRPKEDRKFVRYFSLVHLHNHPGCSDRELRQTRAALSKVLNSLSRDSRIHRPRPIDPNETILAINLKDYGWTDRDDWLGVARAYPYDIKPTEPNVLNKWEEVREEYGVQFDGFFPIRADWFVREASRPPLYHQLADIPEDLKSLQVQLGVDFEGEFKLGQGRVLRAGVQQSGVSRQNRLIDRLSGKNGRYWASYDFETNAGRGNIMRFPLGPKFDGNEFNALAFEHAGGEIIFERPNGLDGYMLVDAAGKRIDRGPIKIVRDSEETAGTPEIVNGVSCMACHVHGIIPFTDDVGGNHAITNQRDAQRKIAALYAGRDILQQTLEDDGKAYLDALDEAMLPFLAQDEDAGKSIEEFREPVRDVVRRYDQDLDLQDVAAELGVQNVEELRVRLNAGGPKALGLGPLLDERTIKRTMWDSKVEAGGTSVFRLLAELILPK